MVVTIESGLTTFSREPIAGKFGFKGAYMSEIYQALCYLQSGEVSSLGLGTQNALWSDSRVFAERKETVSNLAMIMVTDYAVEMLKGKPLTRPDLIIDENFIRQVHEYTEDVLGRDVRLTFSLNSLVAPDNALWGLYRQVNGFKNLGEMIPDYAKPGLTERAEQVAVIPLMSYTKTEKDIKEALDQGYMIMKLKIGHPTKHEPGSEEDREQMLGSDMNRLKILHNCAKDRRTDFTEQGWVPYYLDANGRYGTSEDDAQYLHRLLDYADKIGALERIMILEEPFDEGNKIDYHQFSERGIKIAADESAHSVKDVITQIEKGARLIALKPIAKTLSETFRMILEVNEYNKEVGGDEKVYCFCADLTVIPELVQLNMAIAARLPKLPGMKVAAFEKNGHQHYKNWRKLRMETPYREKPWAEPVNGVFNLDEFWYETDGGIWTPTEKYLGQVKGLTAA